MLFYHDIESGLWVHASGAHRFDVCARPHERQYLWDDRCSTPWRPSRSTQDHHTKPRLSRQLSKCLPHWLWLVRWCKFPSINFYSEDSVAFYFIPNEVHNVQHSTFTNHLTVKSGHYLLLFIFTKLWVYINRLQTNYYNVMLLQLSLARGLFRSYSYLKLASVKIYIHTTY